jgi:hypothetical protein
MCGSETHILLQGIAIHDRGFLELAAIEVFVAVLEVALLDDIRIPGAGDQHQQTDKYGD